MIRDAAGRAGSSHDHGNCQLCDEIEARVETLEGALAATVTCAYCRRTTTGLFICARHAEQLEAALGAPAPGEGS